MQSESILVVDRESSTRDLIERILFGAGYSVESVDSGQDAPAKFRSGKYGLVITGMTDLLDEVKRADPEIPVIVTAAGGTVSEAVESMQRGASDYILKPFPEDTIKTAVKKALSGRNGRSGSTGRGSRKKKKSKKIITGDPKLLGVLELAQRIAPSDATVLIQGPSGTGKELLAAYIHENSGRNKNPYVALNCAALPENLAESELFGYEKGAFTGAAFRKIGKFELAHNGTLLLDEISEMPPPLQAKLLRAIQEKEIDRVGGARPVPVDARIIAVSNVDLKTAVKDGKFREDLFYRLNVVPVKIPPLRERRNDIPLLAKYFLDKYAAAHKRDASGIADETMAVLMRNDWPGNVRELENTIERAVLIGTGNVLLPEHLLLESVSASGGENSPRGIEAGISVREMEEQLIAKTLEHTNNNRTHAAEMLGISIRTLRNKLREYKEREMPDSG